VPDLVASYNNEEMRDPRWLFPRFLLGTTKDVLTLSKRMIREVSREKIWIPFHSHAECVDIRDDRFTIQISDQRHYPIKAELWRLYLVPPVLKDVSLKSTGNYQFYRQMMIACSQELCGALMLLDQYALGGFDNCHDIPTIENRKIWNEHVFQALINWLPEILLLKQRVAAGIAPEVLQVIEGSGLGILHNSWASGLMDLCFSLGVPDSIIQRTYVSGDIVGMLLQCNLIKREGDRFAVTITPSGSI
jgi:hypothetical protein